VGSEEAGGEMRESRAGTGEKGAEEQGKGGTEESGREGKTDEIGEGCFPTS